jgi:hypothetical protein
MGPTNVLSPKEAAAERAAERSARDAAPKEEGGMSAEELTAKLEGLMEKQFENLYNSGVREEKTSKASQSNQALRSARQI